MQTNTPIDKPYREQYSTDPDSDVINTPGKFEGECIYVPFYYDSWGNGCASEEFGNVAFFAIMPDERKAFPELGSAYGLALEESEQGFVNCTVYDTPEQYETAVYDAEKAQESDEDEGEHFRCDQCEALMINGVFCHETGCPNIKAKYIDGAWVKFYECFECGYEVREGEVCDCQTPAEDDDAEVL